MYLSARLIIVSVVIIVVFITARTKRRSSFQRRVYVVIMVSVGRAAELNNDSRSCCWCPVHAEFTPWLEMSCAKVPLVGRALRGNDGGHAAGGTARERGACFNVCAVRNYFLAGRGGTSRRRRPRCRRAARGTCRYCASLT